MFVFHPSSSSVFCIFFAKTSMAFWLYVYESTTEQFHLAITYIQKPFIPTQIKIHVLFSFRLSVLAYSTAGTGSNNQGFCQ